jgi:hypothetical protein
LILLFDIDSLLYSSCCNVETFEDAVFKFSEIYHYTINKVEESYEVEDTFAFGLCRGNYRYALDKNYKGNRKGEKPDYYHELSQYIAKEFNVKSVYGVETDDLVAKYHDEIGVENCIIISIDKDYKQLEGVIYNYIKEEFYEIDQKQAQYNFWEQMVTGDSGDNVNYLKGYGKKWCEKHLKADNEFGYMRIVFGLFKKLHKRKAREMFLKQYFLLKLNAF